MRWQKKICLPKPSFILPISPNIIQTSLYSLSISMTPPSSTPHLPFFFSSSPHSNILLSSLNRFHDFFFNHTSLSSLLFQLNLFCFPSPLFSLVRFRFFKIGLSFYSNPSPENPINTSHSKEKLLVDQSTAGFPIRAKARPSPPSFFLYQRVSFSFSLSISPCVCSFESLQSRFQHCLRTMINWLFVPYSGFF